MVSNTVRQLLEKRQQKQKEYFDQGTRVLQKLQTGDSVRILQDGIWKPAQVTELSDQPRSYVVQTPDGQMYRRNRKFLMQSKVKNNMTKDRDNQNVTQQNLCDKTDEPCEADIQNKTQQRNA